MGGKLKTSRKNSIQEWADPFFVTEYFRDQKDSVSSFHDLQRLSSNFDKVHFKLESHKKDSKYLEQRLQLSNQTFQQDETFQDRNDYESDLAPPEKVSKTQPASEDFLTEYQRRY